MMIYEKLLDILGQVDQGISALRRMMCACMMAKTLMTYDR